MCIRDREVVELRFGSDRNEQMADPIRKVASSLEVLPDRLLAYTDDGESLLHHLAGEGITPMTSLVRRAGLEDVFLTLTGRSLIE